MLHSNIIYTIPLQQIRFTTKARSTELRSLVDVLLGHWPCPIHAIYYVSTYFPPPRDALSLRHDGGRPWTVLVAEILLSPSTASRKHKHIPGMTGCHFCPDATPTNPGGAFRKHNAISLRPIPLEPVGVTP